MMSLKNNNFLDLVFQFIENNDKCLEINPSTENTKEKLCLLFNDVYHLSIKTDSNSEHQQSNNFQNSFPNDFFDLIIIHNWQTLYEFNNKIFLNLLKESERILKKQGCLLFIIEQNTNFLSYQSTLENTLNNFHFKLSKNWILPSINNPLYSGNINNQTTLTWFLKNLDNFIPSFKKKNFRKNFLLKFVHVLDKKLIPIFLKFSPLSVIVCCTKNNLNSYESFILKKTHLNSSILVNRAYKLLFILFNKDGIPKQTVSINKKLINKQTNQNLLQKLDDVAEYRDWIEGRIIDPLKKDEVLLAISWIMNFQKKNQKNILTKNEIDEEITFMKQILYSKLSLKKAKLLKWLEEYENFLKNSLIYKTSIHGDLSHKNMILKPDKKHIGVIDWNFSKEIGNPMDDIGSFIFRLYTKSKSKNKLSAFQSKINGEDKSFNELKNQIEKKFSDHFGMHFDILIPVKLHLLKSITKKILQNKDIQSELKYISLITK